MGLIVSWLTAAVGLWLASILIDGFEIRNFKAAAFAALAFGIIHFLIGWLFTAIIAVGTLGVPFFLGLGFVVRWVVTAVVLRVTDAFSESLTIRGWAPAFWAAAVLSLVTVLRDWLI
jgi:putative membrane protein